MKPVKINPGRRLIGAVCIVSLVLAACAATAERADPHQALLVRLGGGNDIPLLAEGRMSWEAVEWVTFVRSFPPDAISVTRDAEGALTTLGMAGGRVWGLDEQTGQVRDLPAEFSYVLRQQELFRLADRLAVWQFTHSGEAARVDGTECRQLHYLDDFGQPVTLCLSADTGLPLIISIETPPLHGGGTLHVYPREWETLHERTYLSAYDIVHGQREYHQIWRTIAAADEALDRPRYPAEPTLR